MSDLDTPAAPAPVVDPRRAAVPLQPGTAGRAFDLELPAGAVIVGAERRPGWVHVDYLLPVGADVERRTRRPGQLVRATNPTVRRASAPVTFAPTEAWPVGDAEYVLLGAASAAYLSTAGRARDALAAEAAARARVAELAELDKQAAEAAALGAPAAHEQPADPAANGATESGS